MDLPDPILLSAQGNPNR